MSDLLNNPYVIKALMSAGLALTVFILSRLALSVSNRRGEPDAEAPYAIRYTALFFFAVGMVLIWLEGLAPIFTALTIVAAALTIVSKELLLNFLGSFVIFWRELFGIGDRIQIGDYAGDVVDKGLLYFTIVDAGRVDGQSRNTGRLIKVPNSLVLTMAVINATRGTGFVWNEQTVVLTLQSDRDKARQLLLDCYAAYAKEKNIDQDRIKASFKRSNINFTRVEPKVYMTLAKTGLRFSLRYLCRTRMIRESEDYILGRFLDNLEPGVVEMAPEQD